jgi:hypothetical protein
VKKIQLTLLLTGLFALSAACGAQSLLNADEVPLPGRITAQDDVSSGRSLHVTGSGTVTLAPDIAYVTLGIRSENGDASQAVEDNNQASQSLADALEDFGIAAVDIQTSNFNIYSWEDFNEFSDDGAPGTIYSVENSVHVTVRDVDTLGDLLSVAVDAGANSIWGIQFDVEDRGAALAQSRELAVDNANAQAEALADLADVELGQIMVISTNSAGFPIPLARNQGGGGDAIAFDEAASSVPLSPGLITISTHISVVFEIK